MGNYLPKPNLPWLALRHSEVMTLACVRSWVQSPALKPGKQHPLSPPFFPKRNLTSDFLCPGLLTWICLFRVLLVAGRFCACLAKEIIAVISSGKNSLSALKQSREVFVYIFKYPSCFIYRGVYLSPLKYLPSFH